MSPTSLSVNGRAYKWPDRPLVVVCVDGCEPDYVNQAIEAGIPTLQSAITNLTRGQFHV